MKNGTPFTRFTRLFRASKSLLSLSKGSGLPLSTNDYQLANDFGKFFAQKIADIRSVNTNQICLPINATSTVTPSCFSQIWSVVRIRGV